MSQRLRYGCPTQLLASLSLRPSPLATRARNHGYRPIQQGHHRRRHHRKPLPLPPRPPQTAAAADGGHPDRSLGTGAGVVPRATVPETAPETLSETLPEKLPRTAPVCTTGGGECFRTPGRARDLHLDNLCFFFFSDRGRQVCFGGVRGGV